MTIDECKMRTELERLRGYSKKLEKRIHKQRVMLRKNWDIVEQRATGRANYRVPRWLYKSIELSRQLKTLTDNHVILQNENQRLHEELAQFSKRAPSNPPIIGEVWWQRCEIVSSSVPPWNEE